ncbi:MAG: ribosome small subunit-dependent GTPase A [Opitutaceae bacterium]|nr:ribosome small subunit-dependent GTPase A [Verrucomicrobiales bacterium]
MAKRKITLETLCWNEALEQSFAEFRLKGWQPARVAVEDKHHYVLFNADEPVIGKIPGRLLHQCKSTAELPKVGDWVAFSLVPNEDKAIIHHVLPRRTKLSRKVVGRETEEQVLVTNVDIAFVVQALDRSFNPGLIQRHLAMVVEGGVKPVVVLNKADLCDDILAKLATVEGIADQAPVIAVSARTGRAMDSLTQLVRPGQTVVFIGASGVGKSSLINHIYGDDVLPTTEVRESDAKGRHTTSWRELIVLPKGGLVIDTPGMREFQMWLSEEAGQEAFADVEELATKCHFRSCSHSTEKRCALLEALAVGGLARERYDNYIKLKRELKFLNQAAHRRDLIINKRQTKSAQRVLDQRKFEASQEAEE